MRIDTQGEEEERPFAYADPRSLSEAWYQALYGNKPGQGKSLPQHAPEHERHAESEASHGEPIAESASETFAQAQAFAAAPEADVEGRAGGEVERRPAQAVRAAAKAQAARPNPQNQPERSDVDVKDGNGAAIRLMLSQRGSQVEVVAVTDAAESARVAEALARARTALGARGIDLHPAIRERGER